MYVSLAELHSVMSRAALAVRLPMGLGLEAAGAARRMMAGSFGSLDCFVVAFDSFDKGSSVSFDYNMAAERNFVPRSAEKFLSSLCAGPSACDIITAQRIEANQQVVSLGYVDAPMVILCQALIATKEMDKGLLVSWSLDSEKNVEAVCWADSLFLLKGTLDGSSVMTGAKVTLRAILNKPPDSSLVSNAKNERSAIWIDDAVWQYFSKHADSLLVESTQVSRLRGAGAGVIDAD